MWQKREPVDSRAQCFRSTNDSVSSCKSQMNLHVSPAFLAKCVCVIFLREKMPFHHVTAGLLYKGNYLNRSLSDSDSDVLASISVEELAGEVSLPVITSKALKHEPAASPFQSHQSPVLLIPQVARLPSSICSLFSPRLLFCLRSSSPNEPPGRVEQHLIDSDRGSRSRTGRESTWRPQKYESIDETLHCCLGNWLHNTQ